MISVGRHLHAFHINPFMTQEAKGTRPLHSSGGVTHVSHQVCPLSVGPAAVNRQGCYF